MPGNPYVTKNGRAISPGTVTRASLRVRRKHDGYPLPIELQCYPKALKPTSHNPECATVKTPWGGQLKTFKGLRATDFMQGRGLLRMTGRYLVRTKLGKLLGRTDDIRYAVAWRTAAACRSIIVRIEDGET